MLESILASGITLPAFLICTAVSLVLGIATAFISMYRTKCSQSFAVTLAVLPAIVQIVIMLVNGNVGAGVAVAGAFSLVRFRSVPGTAREIGVIFLTMALGLATGMGYVVLAAVFFVIIAAVLFLLTKLGFGTRRTDERLLRITIPENLDYDGLFDDLFATYTTAHTLERVKTANMGTLYELQYRVTRITGFNAGADDYLPKPFAPDELICRVRAMLRRGGEYRPTVLTFGDVGLDCSTGMLSCTGQSVRLSGREFQVMELFLRAPKVVLSAERILERVWGWDSDAEINVVWVHISNLRKKLKGIGSTVTIRANRGLGYVLEVSDD